MFQFPRFPPLVLCVQTRVTPHDGCGVSPFGHPRIEARSAAPRGFSQPPTSFIGSRCQGIHRWLFIAWNQFFFIKDARARYGVLKVRCRSLVRPPAADFPRRGQRRQSRHTATARVAVWRLTGGCPFKTEQKVWGPVTSSRRRVMLLRRLAMWRWS